jgi:hypothetical protein
VEGESANWSSSTPRKVYYVLIPHHRRPHHPGTPSHSFGVPGYHEIPLKNTQLNSRKDYMIGNTESIYESIIEKRW